MACLVVITGPAASGKTTFANILATRMTAVMLDFDTVSMPLLVAVARSISASLEEACRIFREARYETAMDLAIENLKYAQNVILCAPFSREVETTGYFKSLKEDTGLAFNVIECRMQISAENLAQRIVKRDLARDKAKTNDPITYARRSIERRHLWDPNHVFNIDANQGKAALVVQAQRIAQSVMFPANLNGSWGPLTRAV